MFPSSSRVKINRVALKDVVGLKLVPRRRRVLKSPNKVTADAKQHEEKKDVSGVMSVKNIASVPNSNKPVQSFLTDHMGPENVSDTASNTAEGEPEDSCVGTQKAKRRKRYEPCRDNVSMEFKQKGPYTRGKYHQSKPYTRSKCRLDHIRNTLNLRLKL
ncbi:uncharacterized protein topaz1 isoform X1 [Lates japonicus]|uniref:Uncharacterized protein n=1 Tax=Lates japonicus TaxID=270547 RepID=A0AAD3MQA6_LATJO|nr:uncharacterized protein AKAME5_001011400 [Lates japonicus]